MRLVDLAPATWFQDRAQSSVWVSIYRVERMTVAEMQSLARAITVEDGVLAFGFGDLSYLDASGDQWRFPAEGGVQFQAKAEQRTILGGAWLFLMAPFDIDGRRGDEPETRRRISSLAGLASVCFGRNAVSQKVCDQIIEVETGRVSTFGPVVANPAALPKPDLAPVRFELFSSAADALAARDAFEQNQIILSLHWHDSALRSVGIDAFLKSWVAIEVLKMPDSTNIRPINEALARAYQVSLEEATKRFEVGRLFGLRSRILHQGELPGLHFLVEAYTQAIYSDLLCDYLELPSQNDAEAVRAAPGFDLDKFLAAPSRGLAVPLSAR